MSLYWTDLRDGSPCCRFQDPGVVLYSTLTTETLDHDLACRPSPMAVLLYERQAAFGDPLPSPSDHTYRLAPRRDMGSYLPEQFASRPEEQGTHCSDQSEKLIWLVGKVVMG